jgi:hypothetical protein
MNMTETSMNETLNNLKVNNIFEKLTKFFTNYDILVSNYESIVQSNNDIYETFLNNIENAENNFTKIIGNDTLNVGNPDTFSGSRTNQFNSDPFNKVILSQDKMLALRTSSSSDLVDIVEKQNEYCKKVQQFLNSINQYLGQVGINLEKNNIKQEKLKKFSQTLIRAYSSRDSSILEQLNTTQIIDIDKEKNSHESYTTLLDLEKKYEEETNPDTTINLTDKPTETQTQQVFTSENMYKEEDYIKLNSQLNSVNNNNNPHYLDLEKFDFQNYKKTQDVDKEPIKIDEHLKTTDNNNENSRLIEHSVPNLSFDEKDSKDKLTSKDIVYFSNLLNQEMIHGIIYDEKISGHLGKEYYKIISFINNIAILNYIDIDNIFKKDNNINFTLLNFYKNLKEKENNIINIKDFKFKILEYLSFIKINDRDNFINTIKKEYDYIFFENFINSFNYLINDETIMDNKIIQKLIEILPEGFDNNNLIKLNYPQVLDGKLDIPEYVILISNSKKNIDYNNKSPILIIESLINNWTKFLQYLIQFIIEPLEKKISILNVEKKDYKTEPVMDLKNKWKFFNDIKEFTKNILKKFSYVLKYYTGVYEKQQQQQTQDLTKTVLYGGDNTIIHSKKNNKIIDYSHKRKLKKTLKK